MAVFFICLIRVYCINYVVTTHAFSNALKREKSVEEVSKFNGYWRVRVAVLVVWSGLCLWLGSEHMQLVHIVFRTQLRAGCICARLIC